MPLTPAALHGAAGGRGRPAVAQHDLDADARRPARPRFRRRQLLRRPGLHGAEEARGEERQGAEGRHHLRAGGHHHEQNVADYFRTNKMTFKPVVSRTRPDPRRLLLRPLRCLHRRPGAASTPRALAKTRQARRLHHPAGDHLQGAAGPGRCATATTSSPTSCAGRSTPCSRPRNGITSKNVDEMLKSDNPAIKRILGVTPAWARPRRRRQVGLQHRQAGR